MFQYLKSIPKAKYWDYFILVARFLLGLTFLNYGYSKLTANQFGITPEELAMPVKDVSLFRLSWYLFDHQPFKMFIGISQIICGALLLINRTVILGAFLFLPIITTILIIDLTFMPYDMAILFAWRLSFYILFDLLILYHYKEKMLIIWQAVWKGTNTKYKFRIWAYLILPILALGLEFGTVIPKTIVNLIIHPTRTIQEFKNAPKEIKKIINKMKKK